MPNCIKCNSKNNCSKNNKCWCFHYPQILDTSGNTCLCATCLKKEIVAKIEVIMSDISKENMTMIKEIGPCKNP